MSTKIPATLRGNVVAKPEYGVTKDGKPWANFSIAVNSRYLDRDTGEWVYSDTEYHEVKAYGVLAENLQRSGLDKGQPVIAMGDISFDSYTREIEGKEYTFQTRALEATTVGPDLLLRPIGLDSGVAEQSPKVEGVAVESATPEVEVKHARITPTRSGYVATEIAGNEYGVVPPAGGVGQTPSSPDVF